MLLQVHSASHRPLSFYRYRTKQEEKLQQVHVCIVKCQIYAAVNNCAFSGIKV